MEQVMEQMKKESANRPLVETKIAFNGEKTDVTGVATIVGSVDAEGTGARVLTMGKTNYMELLSVTEHIVQSVVTNFVDDEFADAPEEVKAEIRANVLETLCENVQEELTKERK